MSLLIQLFLEFFKIGLFAVGGGLATIPFLHQLAEKYTWFTVETLVDMIAISESTPGAMGVNMATYTGFTTAGIPGSLVATLGLVLPSIAIIIVIAHFLKQSGRQGDLHGAETRGRRADSVRRAESGQRFRHQSERLPGLRQSDGFVSVKKYYSVRCIIILNDENQKASDRLDRPVGGSRRPASVLICPLPALGSFLLAAATSGRQTSYSFSPRNFRSFCDAQKRSIKNPQSNRGQF